MKIQNLGMIPIFIPHIGCPHICIFCNQRRIALGRQERVNPTSEIPMPVTPEMVANTIKEYIGNGANNKIWEVAFYGGTFTAMPQNLQELLLAPAKEALDQKIISHIRCSTRPDAISDEILTMLKEYGVTTVELGVQSLNNEVLKNAKRGHTAEDVYKAVALLRSYDFKIGLQYMPGLPGDTWQTIVKTTVEATQLQPDFVRIYPVLVIDDTELADAYRSGQYTALTMDEALAYSAFMKTYFENHQIDVIRTGLQATEELDKGNSVVAGPYSPSFGEETINLQILHKLHYGIHILKATYGNNLMTSMPGDEASCDGAYISIRYPRAMTSKVRGLKNRNVSILKELYGDRIIWEEMLTPSKRVEITYGKTTIVV